MKSLILLMFFSACAAPQYDWTKVERPPVKTIQCKTLQDELEEPLQHLCTRWGASWGWEREVLVLWFTGFDGVSVGLHVVPGEKTYIPIDNREILRLAMFYEGYASEVHIVHSHMEGFYTFSDADWKARYFFKEVFRRFGIHMATFALVTPSGQMTRSIEDE